MTNTTQLPTLGDTIREARAQEGLGVRELARRSGIAASQISRIESGEVKQPELKTLIAMAGALGRTWLALEFLADPARADANTLVSQSLDKANVLRDLRLWSDAELEDLWRRQFEDDEQSIVRLCAYARDLFLHVPLSEEIERFAHTAHYSGMEAEQLQELITAWIGLTPERRDLVAAYLAEQAVLSELDRRDSNPQKVLLEVRRRNEVEK
jgi:transcriptional regulator with XRE-family HTH domain